MHKAIHRGFTLVEMLISTSLISILLVILTTILQSALETQLSSIATSNVEQEGRFILARIAYDLQRAESVVSPLSNQSAASLSLSISGDTYVFASDSGQLWLTRASGVYTLMQPGTTISNLLFTGVGTSSGTTKPTEKIYFTLTDNSSNPPETRDFEVTVGPR